MFDQRRTQRDHHPTHNQSAYHAPYQQPVLQPIIHAERAKNYQKKKQIVDAKSLFNQIAGKEFQRRLVAIKIEHCEPEQDGNCNPAEAGDGCLANSNLVGMAVKNAQIQRNRDNDEKIERNPVKGRAHCGALRR